MCRSMQCFYVIIFYSILTKVCSTLDTNMLDLKVNCSLLQFWQKDAAKENKSCDAINAPVYHCAWDIFTLQYEEICRSKSILIRIGSRPTIQGGLHYGPCPPNRYQPFHIVSNLTVGCALQKTNCLGEGQEVYEDNDPKRDTTCRCDYTKGYDFVQPPRNNCFCIPSEEDCSCYIKTCMNMSDVLDPEYNCVDEYNRSSYENNTQCLPIQLKKGASTDNDISINRTSQTNAGSSSHNGITAAVICSLFIISGLIVVLLSTTTLKVVTKLNNQLINCKEGDPAAISIDVYGIAWMASMQWIFLNDMKKRQTIDSNDRWQCSKVTRKSWRHRQFTWRINKVYLSDNGMYECMITNLIGRHFSCECTLGVEKKPVPADLKDKKKIIEENTEKRIRKHKLDETFYHTTAIEKGTRLLDSINILVLLGTEKCGKTEACLSLCTCFKDKGFAIIYITSSDKEEVKNISYYIYNDKKQIYVFDINVTPTEEDVLTELLKVANLHANENIKFILTVKTSAVKNVLDDFPAEQQVEIDFLNEDDKRGILMNHMKLNNIVDCTSYQEANYEDLEKLKQDEKIKIPKKVIDDITKAETTGQFPHLCKSFCSTRSLLPLEDRFFKNPPRSLIDAICEFRSSEDEVLYVTLAYILMDDNLGNEVNIQTINTICNKMQKSKDKYAQYQIKDAAKKLKNKYTYLKEKDGLFMFSSDILKKAVWISHIDIDAEYCVMNCQWEYVTDLLRPRNWPVHDKDVCIAVEVSQLTSRLISEMEDIGSAWSVGTYLRKLSEKGKELTDNFCGCMKTKDLRSKTDIILSFLNGITDIGSYTNVFSFSESIKDFVMWPHLDKNNNSILHFCIIQNVEFICNDISIELRKAFVNMKNKKKYSPCALAFYFGRSNILQKHAEQIPTEYEYYRVFKYMTSHGEKHAGKNISSTDLNFVSLDLPLNSVQNVKFGKRQEYFTINQILVALKNKTMVLIRIQGLPSKVKNKEVKDTLSSKGCNVLNVYPEKYREKGNLTDINTGDLIAVCKFTNKSLPSELTIREHNVTTETMVRIKIFKLPSYVRDYQIDNALSLQKCTVKELFPEIKQTTGDKFIDYIAVCTPMENTLPEQIYIDQYICYTSVMTTIRFKSPPKEINASEIENLLKRQHFDVNNTYREKRRKEGKLTNIKTGDRIAICKPFAHQLPSSLAFGNFQERYKIQRE